VHCFIDFDSYTILSTIFFSIFFRGVAFKIMGGYGKMTNSEPSGRLI